MSNPLNITTAAFGGLREVATSPLWQWDYGQILKITGLDLPQAFEVHFSNSRKSGETITQIGTGSQVVIPDMYLTSGADIYCFIFLHDGTDDGETEYVIKIPVRERPEPSDIEPTPEQQDVITEAIAALNAAVAQCGAYVEHYPTVVDGYWYVWDEASEQFVSTGVPATGNGIASARLNSDYTLTLVFTDGTSFTTPISIRGEKGEPGEPGAKGDPGAKGEPGATGNGIASIAKTATVGLVDTYTITFTDGTTTTVDVTNGAEAIDATLSISGRAADAKATGDAVNDLKSGLLQDNNKQSLWANGAIATVTGEESTSTTRIRSIFLPHNTISVHLDSGYKAVIYVYDGFVYSGAWNGESIITSAATWFTGYVDLSALSEYHLRLVFAKDDNSAIDPSSYNHCKIITKTDANLSKDGECADAYVVGGKISAINTDIAQLEAASNVRTVKSKNLLNPDDLTVTGQYYTSGYGNNTSASYKSYAHLVEVDPSTAYTFSVDGSTSVVMVTRVELNADLIKVAGGYNQSATFTTSATTKYLLVSIDASMATKQVQLEKGSSATDFEEYFTPYKDGYSALNGLKGKKICSFGDSLAAGDNGNRTATTWVKLVANYFGATAYNRGIGSSCVTSETSAGVDRVGYSYIDADGDAGEIRLVYSTQRTFANYPTEINPCMETVERVNTIPTDTNVVVIMAGVNDIGTVTLEGFKTAYRTMLNNIIDRVPNAKIYPCTLPFQQTYDLGSSADIATYNSYRTAIKDVATEYGFEYIDLRAKMGVNAENYSSFMSDATHYSTSAGKKRMAECVIATLKGYSCL